MRTTDKINWFAVERKCGKLGSTQKELLRCLAEYGGWESNCGWTWTTPTRTKCIMDSLVKRGVAELTDKHYKIKGDFLV